MNFLPRKKSKEDLNEPAGVKRITLLSGGYTVGYGLIFPDGYTQLSLLFLNGLGQGIHTINAPRLSAALQAGWAKYPGLDWGWVNNAQP